MTKTVGCFERVGSGYLWWSGLWAALCLPTGMHTRWGTWGCAARGNCKSGMQIDMGESLPFIKLNCKNRDV